MRPNPFPGADGPAGNRLLSRLPAIDLKRIGRRLDRVPLRHDVIYQQDARIHRVYFPVTGLLSVIAELQTGRALEVGTIGPEGMGGLPLYMGSSATPHRVVSQIAG